MRPTEAHPGESTPLTATRTVPQKRSHHHVVRRTTGRNAPTTFFMRTEEELEQMASPASRSQADSTFGVQSLSSTVDTVASISQEDDNLMLEPRIWDRRDSDYDFSPPHAQLNPTILSPTPLTPLYLRSPIASSGIGSGAPSTPKSLSVRSLRLSDDDSGAEDSGSQAVASSSEEDDDVEEKVDSYTPPQLVMPSISMPSRRPFTERGKNIGKLKILVAGPKGTGKSTLISSIIQTSEDIVHVDSVSSSSMILSNHENRSSNNRTSVDIPLNTCQISEIHASTRAYPGWWSELDESRVLRRRKSTNEPVLERNICFIDTPGITDEISSHSQMSSVVDYVENLLWRSQSFTTFSDGEILGMLSGNGGVYVDIILFMLPGVPRPIDLDIMTRLSRMTNVMPILSKADLFSPEEQNSLKLRLLESLQSQDLRPFLFGNSISDLLKTSPQDGLSLPYAVSSLPSPDHDTMDASLLMSSHYTQPLHPSDLSALTTRLLDPDTTAHLRHTSARKFLQWRRSTTTAPPPALTNSTPGTTTSTLTPRPPFPPRAQTSPFALARLADHTTREERLSQVHLARWAADLQQAIQNERERYLALQRDERRSWLAERMSECVDEELATAGMLEYSSLHSSEKAAQGRTFEWGAPKTTGTGANMSARDPLGLLEWDERVRRRGVVLVKVLGGCGVIGALVVWAFRSWGANHAGGFAGGWGDWGVSWGAGWWGSGD